MIASTTLAFLRDLKKHNNKDWFDKNKERYLSAKEDTEKFAGDFIRNVSAFDKTIAKLEAKKCMFRIYRDVRFSKNKNPYKTNLGASINAGGKKSNTAGYYIHIEPGESFLAGGIWMPPGEDLKKIRQEIDYNGKDLVKILSGKDFKKYFGKLDPSYKLKTTPKGYSKDHPHIELLRFNSYIVWRSFNDKETTGKNFLNELVKGAKIMKPLIVFLNTAID